MQRADVFSVQMHGDIVIKRDDRQRALRLSLLFHVHRSAGTRLAAFLQSFADVIVRNDGSLLLKKFVPARVVSVVVRVDDKAHWLVGNAFEGYLNFVSKRSVLII